MLRIVGFNGPPRSGKDTLANALLDELLQREDTVGDVFSLAEPFKKALHLAFGSPYPYHHYDDIKDIPAADFHGLTPRQVYIHGIQALKQNLIYDLPSRTLMRRIRARFHYTTAAHRWAMITDVGMQEDLNDICAEYPAEQILLVKVHRQECSFAGDSRYYLPHDPTRYRTLTIRNDDTVESAIGRLLQHPFFTSGG